MRALLATATLLVLVAGCGADPVRGGSARTSISPSASGSADESAGATTSPAPTTARLQAFAAAVVDRLRSAGVS